MVSLSKYLVEQLSQHNFVCNEVLHPNSCKRATLENLYRFAWSNTKYYSPMALLYFLRHLLHGFNGTMLRDSMWYYAQLVFGGLANGFLISTSMCGLRHILGEFRLGSLIFVPAIFGGSVTAFLPARAKHLEHTGIFQALIESLLMQRSNIVTKTVSSSLMLQTLLFMGCSAIILLGKERRWHKGFWFLTPETLPPKDTSNLALYVLQGMRKYLLIGLALDTFKALMTCIKTGLWQWKHLRLESMAWLGCYAGIYRTLLCCFQGRQELSEPWKQILASFLGGISYVFYPKLTILSYALLEAIRTLWSRYNGDKRKRFDFSDLIFPIALAYLIHMYVLEPDKVSLLAGIIVDNTTANYATNIRRRLLQLQSL